MKLYEVQIRTSHLMDDLLKVWEASVRATHLFLSDAEVKQIKTYVPQALAGVEHLIVAENEQNPQAVGFYQHLGFETYKRTDYDEEGNPYPLLYMKLKSFS